MLVRVFLDTALSKRRALPSAHVVLLLLLVSTLSWSQQVPENVNIRVHADQSDGTIAPVWSFFGYDEPNYTYAPKGRTLLSELSALGPEG
jgi:xylan 1,4-beta-xylosidase